MHVVPYNLRHPPRTAADSVSEDEEGQDENEVQPQHERDANGSETEQDEDGEAEEVKPAIITRARARELRTPQTESEADEFTSRHGASYDQESDEESGADKEEEEEEKKAPSKVTPTGPARRAAPAHLPATRARAPQMKVN